MSRAMIPARVYVQRESLIDSIFNERNGRAFYAIVFSLLSIHSIILMLGYILEPGRKDADVNALISVIPGIGYAAIAWILMHAILIVIVFPSTRLHVTSGFKGSFLYSLVMMICAIALIALPIAAIITYEIRYFATAILLMEQLRLLMKMIDYVSVNKDKDPKRRKEELDTEMNAHRHTHSHSAHSHSHSRNGTNGSQHHHNSSNNNSSDLVEVVVPKFSRFLYFLCAPTLIYRDEEANDYADGKKVVLRIFLMMIEISMIFHALFQFTRSVTLRFAFIGIVPQTLPYLMDSFLQCCLLGLLWVFCFHYAYMHNVQNISANLFRFGDRKFYDDYWSHVDIGVRAKNYSRIVADWLDAHVYNPIVKRTNNKALASLVLMIVLSMGLEYIVSFSHGFVIFLISCSIIFFLPIMLMHKSMVKIMDKNSIGYTFLLVTQSLKIIFAIGMVVASYAAEHHSRANCGPRESQIQDLLIPRTFSCMSLTGIPDGLFKKLISQLFTVV